MTRKSAGTEFGPDLVGAAELSSLRAERDELQRAQRFHQAVIAATPDAIHVYDVATETLSRVVPGRALIEFSSEAADVVSGERVDELVPVDDRETLSEALRTAAHLSDGTTACVQHRIIGEDGQTAWLRRRIGVLDRDDAGNATSLVVVSTEITDLVTAEERLRYAATHDELTNLPNRREFARELERRLALGQRLAVAVLNLNGFKPVNDSYGREAGDEVLAAMARRLMSAVRAGDLVARLGGDEFGLLLRTSDPNLPQQHAGRDVTDELHVDRIARRVEQLLAEPVYLDDAEVSLSASVGICLHLGATQAEEMLSAASAAMDRVKRADVGGHYVFDRVLEDELRALEHIERNLRRALREDALEVYYQPIVAPATGTIRSVEALVRLRDENGTLLPVDQVIAVAERCSLVTELDDQMLRKACRQVAAWRREPEHADLRLALNRSAKDLNRPGFHDRIMRRLAASELPADALTLEITESVLLHITSSRADEMARLHDSFVSLAIDDFGTGYASMSQLITLPISAIKIDRSFTSRMLEDTTCGALVRASVRIASDLDLACVVEGVETVAQLDALPEYDRLLVQGFLYGAPRPAETALLIQNETTLQRKTIA